MLYIHGILCRSIDLEKDAYSCGDYIEVFDGLNSWSSRLVKYCNTPEDKQMQFESKANTMRIEFKSNSINNGKGFKAYYTSENIGNLLILIFIHCNYSRVYYKSLITTIIHIISSII
jgi:hypothetical protein